MNIALVIIALVAGTGLIVGGVNSFTKRRSAVYVRRFMRYERLYLTGTVSDIFSGLRILTGMFYLGSVLAAWVGLIDYEAIFVVMIVPLLIYALLSFVVGLIQ